VALARPGQTPPTKERRLRMLNVTEMRKGVAIEMDCVLYQVLDY
jgi:hypothetical protein